MAAPCCPWNIFNETQTVKKYGFDLQQKKTVAEILSKSTSTPTSVDCSGGSSMPLFEAAPPRFQGGNLIVQVCEDEYIKGVEEHQNNLIGKLFLPQGVNLTTLDLKNKLMAAWKVEDWRLIPLGKNYFELVINSWVDRSRILALGATLLHPGIFRLSQWKPDFSLKLHRQTNAQVWMKIHDLPLEYWRPSILFSIARGIGCPLQFAATTILQGFGCYALVLVDVDVSCVLPEIILIQRKEAEFFVHLEYEKLPPYCKGCNSMGHEFGKCRFGAVRGDKDIDVDGNSKVKEGVVSKQDGSKDVITKEIKSSDQEIVEVQDYARSVEEKFDAPVPESSSVAAKETSGRAVAGEVARPLSWQAVSAGNPGCAGSADRTTEKAMGWEAGISTPLVGHTPMGTKMSSATPSVEKEGWTRVAGKPWRSKRLVVPIEGEIEPSMQMIKKIASLSKLNKLRAPEDYIKEVYDYGKGGTFYRCCECGVFFGEPDIGEKHVRKEHADLFKKKPKKG